MNKKPNPQTAHMAAIRDTYKELLERLSLLEVDGDLGPAGNSAFQGFLFHSKELAAIYALRPVQMADEFSMDTEAAFQYYNSDCGYADVIKAIRSASERAAWEVARHDLMEMRHHCHDPRVECPFLELGFFLQLPRATLLRDSDFHSRPDSSVVDRADSEAGGFVAPSPRDESEGAPSASGHAASAAGALDSDDGIIF